ncbi:MAG TPA: preprotein translocase subunit SecE [Syntrophomonadaceae bacterium]|nr:preprotein translocase subunit SecE [Syntrophomonadaceae bacterium]
MAGVYSELKKVHWPDRRQLTTYTGVVLVAVVLMGGIIWLFDSGLGLALDKLFKAFP